MRQGSGTRRDKHARVKLLVAIIGHGTLDLSRPDASARLTKDSYLH